MELIAGIFGGSLGTAAVIIGLALYLGRGHRVDWTGLRVVSTRPDPNDDRFSLRMSDNVQALKDAGAAQREPDYFDQSRERGTE